MSNGDFASDFASLLERLFGASQVNSRDFLNFLESDESKADDCAERSCPVHGEGGLRDALRAKRPDSTVEGLDAHNVTPEIATNLGIGAALGAQVKIERGKYDHAKVMQEQSFLWMEQAKVLREERPWQEQIQETIESADRKLAAHTRQIQVLEGQLEGYRDSHSRLLQGAVKLEQERDELKAELERLTAELDDLKAASDPAE